MWDETGGESLSGTTHYFLYLTTGQCVLWKDLPRAGEHYCRVGNTTHGSTSNRRHCMVQSRKSILRATIWNGVFQPTGNQ